MPRKRAKQRAAVEREAARAQAKHSQSVANTKRVRERRNTSTLAQDEGSSYSPSESDDSHRVSDDTASVPESMLEYQRAMMDATDSEEENEAVWYEQGQRLYPLFQRNAWQNRVHKTVPKKRKAAPGATGKKRGPYSGHSRTTHWRWGKATRGVPTIASMFNKQRISIDLTEGSSAEEEEASEGDDELSEDDLDDQWCAEVVDMLENKWTSIQIANINLEPSEVGYDPEILKSSTNSSDSESDNNVLNTPPGVTPAELPRLPMEFSQAQIREWLSRPPDGRPVRPQNIVVLQEPSTPPPAPSPLPVPPASTIDPLASPPASEVSSRPSPFDALDGTLQKLLAAEKRRLLAEPSKNEKKRKKADTRALYDINILRDWNRVRQTLFLAGERRGADRTAAERIAAAKASTNSRSRELTKGPWFARELLRKARHVIAHGELPPYRQGLGARSKSPLDRPEVRREVEAFIESCEMGKCTPLILQKHVNAVIAPKFGFKPISEKTAYNWMIKLGYSLRAHRKGIYHDGHERPDVVVKRTSYNGFFKTHEHLIRKYSDETDEPLPLHLEPGEKELIVVFHDESCFHANDLPTSSWLKNDQQQLRRKSRGRLVHVSDFIVEQTGRLCLDQAAQSAQLELPAEQRLRVTDARKIIYPGKNADPYWNMEQLLVQLADALAIRRVLYPTQRLVWVFDNSSAHGAFAADALIAHKMNVGSGGSQPKMRSTRIPVDNPDPARRGVVQHLVFQPGEPKAGEAKGMEVVLRERGLYDKLAKGARGKAVGVCTGCKLSETKRDELARKAKAALEACPDGFGSIDDALDELLHTDPDVLRDASTPESETRWCCMRRCLSTESDFLEETPLLQQRIEAEGDICLFLPKFHCELNPIELYWGWTKARFRLRADGTFPTAKRLVPEILDSCDVKVIRRFFRKTWRYQDAYRLGLSGKDAEYAVRKYRSHRRVPASALMDVNLIS